MSSTIPEVEVVAEETAAAGVEILAPEIVTPLVVLGMIAGATAWLRPLFKAQTQGHHNLLWNAVNWIAKKIERGIHALEHRILHAMSHWLAPKIRPVTHFINSTTHIVHTLTQDVGDLADNTHEALTWLRHQVVPELIADATKALGTAITKVERELGALETRLQEAANAVRSTLATVGIEIAGGMTAALAALSAVVVALYQQVYVVIHQQIEKLQAEVRTLTRTVTQTATDLYQDVYPRLAKVEQALAPAALAAAIAAALATSFAYLTCRNTKTAGNALCAADPGLVDDALALLAGAFVLLSLEEYVRIMQSITRDTTEVVHSLLSV